MTAKLLIVDDDADLLEAIGGTLSDHGYEPTMQRSAEGALAAIESEDFDLAITDLKMPSMDGLELCQRIVGNYPTLPVILMSAYGDVDSAVAAIRAGAQDFVTKPFSETELALAVQRALRLRDSRPGTMRIPESLTGGGNLGLIGSSRGMVAVRNQIRRLARSECSVLITGESGCGKELVARALHSSSPRAQGPFVAVNCAAIPANLLESEMFGYAKGAFTGADMARAGLFAAAGGGTLFLDEVGTLPMELQPKLLRVLQHRSVRPVGGTEERPIDVRVVAATNSELRGAVDKNEFRGDLLFRLDVGSIHVPALRDRGDDVVDLVHCLFARHAPGEAFEVSEEAMGLLQRYPWPGNVRELENCVQAAAALARGGRVGVEDLPTRIRTTSPGRKRTPEAGGLSLDAIERAHIEAVLSRLKGNKAKAAEVLGIDRTTLYRRLRRYGITRWD